MEQWQNILTNLQTRTSKTIFNDLLKNTTATTEGNTVTVWVGDPLKVERLPRMEGIILAAIQSETNLTPLLKYGYKPKPAPPKPAATRPPADSGTFSVELTNFDPDTPFVIASIYAVRFWQPLINPEPFALWLALRAFAWDAEREAWPSIQTLADICANGNRHAILGRAAYGQGANRREARPGAIDTLTQWGIATVRKEGSQYRFRVADSLPRLKPEQVNRLPSGLQSAHERWIARFTYVPDIGSDTRPMSRT